MVFTTLTYQTKPTFQTKFSKEQKQSAKIKFMRKIGKSKPDKLKLALSLAQLSPSLFPFYATFLNILLSAFGSIT